jgi:flagellum-specific peptidoglycan hydrolase FlgJ
MADDTTQTAPPTPSPDVLSQLAPYLALLQQGQAQPTRDMTPVEQDWRSKLGEALGGPVMMPNMTPAERQASGLMALRHFGLGMLGATGHGGTTIGGLLSGAFEGAERGALGAQQFDASTLAAQQEYQQKQQELRISALKEALPLLSLQQQMQQAQAARDLASGKTPTAATPAAGGTNIATGGSIAAAGKDDFVQKFTPLAQVVSAQTGLPVDYVIGQAGLETGWGKSPAAANNNFFGITDPKTGKLMSYASPQEGITAYTQLMQSDRYKSVPRTGTPAEIGDRMAQAGYNPNVPAKDKTDSYGARIGTFASGLGQPQPPGAAPAAPTAQTPPAPAPRAPIGTPADALPAGGATVAGPAGAATVGAPKPPGPAVPGDVNAIIAGMTGAGANAATLAPGGAVSAPQAPPAQVATTAPVVPQPTTATTPPPPSPYPDIKAGDGLIRHPGTFAEFSARESVPVPQTELYNPNLTPEQQAAFAAKRQQVDFDRQNLANLPFAKQPEAVAQWKAEDAALQAEIQNAAQAKRQAASAAIEKYNENQGKQVQTRYDAALAAYNTAAQGQLTSTLKSRETAQQADVTRQEKRMEAIDTAAGASRESLNDLDMLRALSNSVGSVSPWSQMTVGGRKVADWIQQYKLGTPEFMAQVGNQQAYEGAVNKIITGLRAGVSMGNLSDRDLDFIRSQAPNIMASPETRGNMIGFLEQVYQRKLDFAQMVSKYYRPGVTSVAEAEDRAGKELGPLLKTPPAFPGMNSDAEHKAQILWLYNNVKPGTFFKDSAGRLKPYNPPAGWQPEGAE